MLYNTEQDTEIIMMMRKEGFVRFLSEGTIPAFSFKDGGKTEHTELEVMLLTWKC
jgi:hypothetical protein